MQKQEKAVSAERMEWARIALKKAWTIYVTKLKQADRLTECSACGTVTPEEQEAFVVDYAATFAAGEVRLLEIENNSLREFGRLERERCAKAICYACSSGREVVKDGGTFKHGSLLTNEYFPCLAAAIWELPRDGGSDD